MSETAHEDWGLDDLDPSALLDLLADADRRERAAARDKLLIAHQWAVLHPATAESGVSTWGGEALLADESLGGEGCPQVAAYAAEPLAITLGVSPVDRQAADHRRPRAAPPPPRNLETRRRPRGPRLEGPPRRRPHPHPLPGGRRVGRPADRPAPAPVRREGRRHRRRPRHRQVRPRPARRTRSPREEADLGRRPAHPDGVGVRRHQRAAHHRRHPLPHRPLPTICARRRGRREGRRRPAPRRPQGPGARHPVHRRSSSDPHRWSSSDPHRWSSSERSERSVETLAADGPLPAPRHHRPRRRQPDPSRPRRAPRPGHHRQDPRVGRRQQRPHPAGDPDGRRRRRRRPRPTRPDARPRHPPRPDLPLPRLPGRQPALRPRPRHPLRPRPVHPAKPDQPTSSRSAADTTTPRPPVSGGMSARPKATACGPGRSSGGAGQT